MTPSLTRLAAVILLLIVARPAAAQVFLSTEPNPEFAIAPLFVSLSVNSTATPPPHLNIFWSIAVPPTSKQALPPDLILLLPFAITDAKEQPGAAGGDLAGFVTARNFSVVRQGAVAVIGRNRSEMGSGRPPQVIGSAPYVTFVRDSAERGRSRSATMIQIPWTQHLTSKDWLVGIDMVATDLIRRKPTSWYDEVFWGPRWTASVSFGDLRHTALYPLYFELRNNVVDIGKDFSMLTINLADADHLRVDQLTPTTATRQPSESRRNPEQISIPIAGGEGITPQVVRVNYTYFSGSFEWRPIVISLLFLSLGNITGPVVVPLVKRFGRLLLARVHVGAEPARQKGVVLDAGTIAKVRPGESTYDDVVKLFGPDYEEHERKHGDDSQRTLRYRGQRLVPQRTWRMGKLSTVRRWDLEMHEVDVEMDNDRVADVNARVRRAKWVPTQTV
jgi:hypothetical protein